MEYFTSAYFPENLNIITVAVTTAIFAFKCYEHCYTKTQTKNKRRRIVLDNDSVTPNHLTLKQKYTIEMVNESDNPLVISFSGENWDEQLETMFEVGEVVTFNLKQGEYFYTSLDDNISGSIFVV